MPKWMNPDAKPHEVDLYLNDRGESVGSVCPSAKPGIFLWDVRNSGFYSQGTCTSYEAARKAVEVNYHGDRRKE